MPVQRAACPHRPVGFEPPRFAFPVVRTEAWCRLTASGLPHKLTAIVAPTGYGKTVLQSALYEHWCQSGVDCRWIALDHRHRAIERVLDLLDVALGIATDDADVTTQRMLRGDLPIEARIDSLIERLATQTQPLLLFCDNLNACRDDTLAALLDRLVYGSPDNAGFVLASTEALPLSLSRARIEGRLREVGFQDLALSREELRVLLGDELCRRIGDDGVTAVLRQTEGWPAAARLAQIILSAAEDPMAALARFSGADVDIADLLNRQVLAAFDQPVRDFLLEIAPLRTFSADLCREATGDAAAVAHVEALIRRNVLIIPLDRNRSAYRLHGLFREFLDSESVRLLTPARRTEVLLRAAQWCERNGQWRDAIDYALMAGSPAVAADILERVAAMFVRDRGDLSQFIAWVEQLQTAGVELGWEADCWHVWALVFHRRYGHARVQNARLQQRVAAALAASPLAPEAARRYSDLLRRVGVIQVAIDTYTDHLGEAHARAESWLAAPALDDPFDVATVATAATISRIGAAQLLAARETMATAQAAIAQANSAYGSSWVALINAMIALRQGECRQVHQELTVALTRARAQLGAADTGIVGTMALVAAKAAVEIGYDEPARELLAQGLRHAHAHGIVDTAAAGLEAAVKCWDGRDEEWPARLREVASSYPPRLGKLLSCFLVQRLIRLGRLSEAEAEADAIALLDDSTRVREASLNPFDRGGIREAAQAARIDLLIAAGRLKSAEGLVQEEAAAARDDGRVLRRVELALAEATIAVCSQQTPAAQKLLARAIGLAARRHLLRPFRDRADLVAGLVNDTAPKSWGFVLEEERSFFAVVCRGLPLGNALLIDELQGREVAGTPLEAPTARELELLSLIELGLSNQQLADRLTVSVATVKWHLYNLYTKLGVSSRSAALARARALNLLAR